MRRALRRLRRRKGAVLGLVVIALFVLLAVFAPLIAPYDPAAQSWTAVRKAPSALHWFGTDEVGRDVLSRVIFGARASLLAGVISVAIALSVGVPLGLLAGYLGGWVDALITRITDAMLAVPFLILAIALAAFLGPEPQQRHDRDRRHRHADLRAPDARAGDGGEGRGLRRGRARDRQSALAHRAVPHPAEHPAGAARAGDAVDRRRHHRRGGLSFLGLGQQPPAPSWGSMLNTAQRFLTNAPWMAIWPGLAIFLTVLSFNLLGDGLRDALDPKER